MNQQPWVFAALLDQQRIASYAQEAKSWLLANISETTFDASARRMLEDPTFVLFHGAPALVLVMAKSSEPQAIEDCCLAAENLLLAARNEGLGSCWIGFARPWLNSPPIKHALGLSQNYHVVAPIALGHPKAWPVSHGRNPREIHWLG
jgi:nitroreductase